MPRVEIRHVPGNPPTVNPSTVRLSLAARDEVEWSAVPANLEFVVCFEKETPFHDLHFYPGKVGVSPPPPPPPGSVRSGAPTVAPRAETYKYTVEVGGDCVDPDVKIDP